MEELIRYIKTHKKATMQNLEKYFMFKDVQEILKKYNLNPYELRYRIHKDIPFNKIYICKNCGKHVNFSKQNGYGDYCSIKCANTFKNKSQEHKDKIKQTCLKKYGTITNLQTEYNKEKSKQTCLKKYGVTNYTKTQKFKDQLKQTSLAKYGVEHHMKTNNSRKYFSNISDICLRKRQQTNNFKYGSLNYTQSQDYKKHQNEYVEKQKSTCLNKYNTEWYQQTQEFKDKYKQTCLDKYGVEHYSQTQECQQKIYNTKKKHNSFHISQNEEQVYQLLLTKFSKDDIKRQYKSKLYPFVCDFYIKSLDLYIEYNGHWTHGLYNGKCLGSFNKDNSEHIKILNLWKSKNTKFYKNAIYVWTILDPLKVKTAKENKINYKIFWNIEEVKEFINKIN